MVPHVGAACPSLRPRGGPSADHQGSLWGSSSLSDPLSFKLQPSPCPDSALCAKHGWPAGARPPGIPPWARTWGLSQGSEQGSLRPHLTSFPSLGGYRPSRLKPSVLQTIDSRILSSVSVVSGRKVHLIHVTPSWSEVETRSLTTSDSSQLSPPSSTKAAFPDGPRARPSAPVMGPHSYTASFVRFYSSALFLLICTSPPSL